MPIAEHLVYLEETLLHPKRTGSKYPSIPRPQGIGSLLRACWGIRQWVA